MNMKETKIQGRMIFNGRILTVTEDTVLLPNGATALREVVEHNGGSCVAALTPQKELLLVRQFRYGADQLLWELPAGKLEKGEDPKQCALRELEEETGFAAKELQSLGIMYPTPAYCREVIHLYFAPQITPAAQHLDPDEFLEVAAIPFSQAVEMVMQGEITDAKTVIAILKLKEILL